MGSEPNRVPNAEAIWQELPIGIHALSPWTVDFLLPAEEVQDRTVDKDCGCAPEGGLIHTEFPYLINTYQFASEDAAQEFLGNAKLLSDVGEFHHHDSYSLSPSHSLTVFVHTHSAINAASVQRPALTMRDIRYAILLDHLYLLSHAGRQGFGSDCGLDQAPEDEGPSVQKHCTRILIRSMGDTPQVQVSTEVSSTVPPDFPEETPHANNSESDPLIMNGRQAISFSGVFLGT
ncbi:hypothetical protein NMY22_g19841 [Coprinellus aureogranulatus]|nr:hypothetical protein NMY22_g19841 [Coprinellus aureogranulatus]